MKRFLLAFISCFCLLTSCERNVPEQTSKNALDGTLWECMYDLWTGELIPIYLEFNGSSVTTWSLYDWYYMRTGTYTVNNDTAYFTGLYWENVAGSNQVKYAQFTNNTMVVFYRVEGNSRDSRLVFYKK